MEHTITSNQCLQNLQQVYKLQEKYSLAAEFLKNVLSKFDDFQVTTPIVGKFSTGKSSLVNALLGKNYLAVDLTPETAVPTEIIYDSEEKILIYDKTGDDVKKISFDEYVTASFYADSVEKISLKIDDDFLKSVSTVKIVDMPGLDSDVELHNRAIDDYLPNSLAYILIVAATEPVLQSSIITFLKELEIYKMPVYIVITKSKSVTPPQLQECIENIKSELAKYIALKDVKLVCTNAKGRKDDIDIEAFKEILLEIEANSQKIFLAETNKTILQESSRLTQYLSSVIQQTELRPSEIEGKKEDCQRDLERLKTQLERTKTEFNSQAENSISVIQSKVNEALNSSASSLASALANGSDINGRINSIVRETLTSAINSEFTPKFRRYLEKINRCVHVDINSNFQIQTSESNVMIDKVIQGTVSNVVRKTLPAILAKIGIVINPVIAGIIGALAGLFFSSSTKQTQREENRQQALQQIRGEIIPQVTAQVGTAVSQNIHLQIDEVNRQIEADAQKQIDDREKTLAELIKNLELESNERQQKLSEMKADLETVNKICSTIEV